MQKTDRRKMLDKLAELNAETFAESGDQEVNAKIQQYEMAYRMQSSVPEITAAAAFAVESAGRESIVLAIEAVHKLGFIHRCVSSRR